MAAGIGAEAAPAAATSAAAEACGLGPSKGRLRTGFDADLLLVQGNPAKDIKALACVEAVYLGGLEVER